MKKPMKFPVRSVGNNLRRVKKIHRIVERYGDCKGDYLTNTIDLLVNIHHYCDAQGWSLEELMRRAHDHYVEEVAAKCSKCGILFDPSDAGCHVECLGDVCRECVKKDVVSREREILNFVKSISKKKERRKK